MATTLLLKKQITLTLDGKKRVGDLHFDYENQQLSLHQNETQAQNWDRLGFTAWRWTSLTHGVPYCIPGNCVEIYDFNHTAGVADQLEKLGIGVVATEKAFQPLATPENPRRIKVVALNRELIKAARDTTRAHTRA